MAYYRLPNGEVYDLSHEPTGAEKLSRAEGIKARKAHCADQIRKILQAGDVVYTVLRHVSGSGMSRRIDAYIIRDNRPQNISAYVADLLGWRLSDKGGIQVSGCGMDMGFHLVYSLSGALYGWNPDGSYSEHGHRALRHEWL